MPLAAGVGLNCSPASYGRHHTRSDLDSDPPSGPLFSRMPDRPALGAKASGPVPIRVLTLELAQRLVPLYVAARPQEKQEILRFLLLNCTLSNATPTPTYRKPSNWLAELAEMKTIGGDGTMSELPRGYLSVILTRFWPNSDRGAVWKRRESSNVDCRYSVATPSGSDAVDFPLAFARPSERFHPSSDHPSSARLPVLA